MANDSCLKSAKTSSGRTAYQSEEELDIGFDSYSHIESTQSETSRTEVTIDSVEDHDFSNFGYLSSYFDKDGDFSSSNSYTKEASTGKTVEIDAEQISEFEATNLEEESFLEYEEERRSYEQNQVSYMKNEDISEKIEELVEKEISEHESSSSSSSSSSSEESSEVIRHQSEVLEKEFVNEYEKSAFMNAMDTENEIFSTPMMAQTGSRFKPDTNSPLGTPSPLLPKHQKPSPTSNLPCGNHPPSFPPGTKAGTPPLPPFMPPKSPVSGSQTSGKMPKPFSAPVGSQGLPTASGTPSAPQIPPLLPVKPAPNSVLPNGSILENGNSVSETTSTYPRVPNKRIRQEELEQEIESSIASGISPNLPITSEKVQVEALETESALSGNIPSSGIPNAVSDAEVYEEKESEVVESASVLSNTPSLIPQTPNTAAEMKVYQEQALEVVETESGLPNTPSLIPQTLNTVAQTEVCQEQELEVVETESGLQNIPSPYQTPTPNTGKNYVAPLPPAKPSKTIPSPIPQTISSNTEVYRDQESEILETETIAGNFPPPYPKLPPPNNVGKNYIPPLLPTTRPSVPKHIPSRIPQTKTPNLLSETEVYQEQESEVFETESVLKNIPSQYQGNQIPSNMVGKNYAPPLLPKKPSLPQNTPPRVPQKITPNVLSETDVYQKRESEVVESQYPKNQIPTTGKSYIPSLLPQKPTLSRNIPKPIPQNTTPSMLSGSEIYQEWDSEILETETILGNNIPSQYPRNQIPSTYNKFGKSYVPPPTKPSNVSPYLLTETETYQEQESEIFETESVLEDIPYSPKPFPQTGYVSPLPTQQPSFKNRPSPSTQFIFSPMDTYEERESEILENNSILQDTTSPYSVPTPSSSTGNKYSSKSPPIPHLSSSVSGYYSSPLNQYPPPKTPMPYQSKNYLSISKPTPNRPHPTIPSSPSPSKPQTHPTTPFQPPPTSSSSSYPDKLSNHGLTGIPPQYPSEYPRSMPSSGPHPGKLSNHGLTGIHPSEYPRSTPIQQFPPPSAYEDVEEIFEEAKQQILDSYSAYPQNVAEIIDRRDINYSTYDVVMLGGGPAALQAAKVFSDYGIRTLIIEKGLLPPCKSNSIYYRPSLFSSEYVTPYPATIPGTNIQKLLYTSNTIGDTTSIDENVWDLGTIQKYQELSDLSEKWSWPVLSQYYNIEKVVDDQSETFLVSGTIPISQDFPKSLITQRMGRAFEELGIIQTTYDMTTPRQRPGATIVPAIYENRGSATYTREIFQHILNRDNVDIALGVELLDINFENGRAVSVVVATPQRTIATIDIQSELIIGGGVVDTVKWLYQCGIGDKSVLQQLQMPTRHHSPSLGKNLSVHPSFPGLCYKFPRGTIINEYDSSDYAGLEYVFGQNRIQPALSLTYFKAFVQLYDANEANVQFNLYAFSQSMTVRLTDFMTGVLQFTEEMQQFVFRQLADGDVLFVIPQLVDTVSRGQIKIGRTDVGVIPIVDTGMYNGERDLKIMIKAVELVRKLGETKTFKISGGKLLQIPVAQCGNPGVSQGYYECALRHLSIPNLHISGGACMGDDRHTSVVDDELKVHGLRNVRIFNAAVLPSGTASESAAIENIIGNYGAYLALKDNWN